MPDATSFALDQGLRVPPLGRRLRLGFVGGGRGAVVGPWHLSGARLSGHWDIVAGALSTDPERAKQSAADWCIAPDRSYSDWRQMALSESTRPDGIEAVAICTPNYTHFPIAMLFLESGIDVIIDKPMTMTVDEADALAKKVEGTGLILSVTYAYAHHAMVRQAQGLIRSGVIGRIRQVIVEYVQDWATAPDAPDNKAAFWRRDPTEVGRTSAAGDIGTHAYHLLKSVTGLAAEAVRADFHVCGGEKNLEDAAFIKLKLSGGVPGHIWVTEAAPGNYCGLRLRVFGDLGGIEWNQESPERLHVNMLGEPEQTHVRGQGAGMLGSALRLSHLPRGHGEALTDAWSNLYAETALAIAARRAGAILAPDLIQYSTVSVGREGVRFMNACADSAEAASSWVVL